MMRIYCRSEPRLTILAVCYKLHECKETVVTVFIPVSKVVAYYVGRVHIKTYATNSGPQSVSHDFHSTSIRCWSINNLIVIAIWKLQFDFQSMFHET